MAIKCGPTGPERLACGQQLERIDWSLGPFSAMFTESVRKCTDDPKSGGLLDYGACVGEVLSAAGYVAAAGLELSDAPGSCNPTLGGTGASCTVTISSGLRAFDIGAAKAVRGAGHCGGKSTTCGRDLTLLGAALLAASQFSGNMAMVCNKPDNKASCTQFSAAVVTELMVISAKALEAANTCKGTDKANLVCGSAVSKILAAIAFDVQEIAIVVQKCPQGPSQNLYNCGRAVERIGQGGDVLSRSIGASAADCGLGENPAASKPIGLPRRFFGG